MKEFSGWLFTRALIGAGLYLLLAAMWGLPPFGNPFTSAQPQDEYSNPEMVPPKAGSDFYDNYDWEQAGRDAADDYARSGSWSCYLSPTINENWHDDVICRNGSESVRPNLLTNDSFVTEAEMLAAAAAYEAELNR